MPEKYVIFLSNPTKIIMKIHKKSATKALTWRVLASLDTFFISFIITGKLSWAGTIAGVEILTKMVLYYAHERVWDRVS
jgi:uncharacterized membrane protein